VKAYPQGHSKACRTDVQFALKWDRHKRAVVPELIVVHLESEKVPKGSNWSGRSTKQFGNGVFLPPSYAKNIGS
jgi:hypothetical protein